MPTATLEYNHTLAIAVRGIGQRFSSIGHMMSWFREDLSLRWKPHNLPGGGRIAYAVIGGNKGTGEIHVLAFIEKGTAPPHCHGAGGVYGELIFTIAGELHDTDGYGNPIVLLPGMHIAHRPGSVHAPGTNDFWFGYFHQPHGAELICPAPLSAA